MFALGLCATCYTVKDFLKEVYLGSPEIDQAPNVRAARASRLLRLCVLPAGLIKRGSNPTARQHTASQNVRQKPFLTSAYKHCLQNPAYQT